MRVTAVFDIGKTNKKCFLFDESYKEVYSEYIDIKEQLDEDGFPCDDLLAITHWIEKTLVKVMNHGDYQVVAVNFSSYGASLVHLDVNGNPLTPLYNYLKPIDISVVADFRQQYGKLEAIEASTASPYLGMLNSGLQLYWLEKTRPEVHQAVVTSLHLPQYLSFYFTGERYSDFTSIGCHTMLWNYAKNNYHTWVYKAGFDKKLAPVVSTDQVVYTDFNNKEIKFGIGVHDSSAALLPYLKLYDEEFILISTGTWSITLNPFSEALITEGDLKNDCLNYMQGNGKPVRASRLFLGHQFSEINRELAAHFEVASGTHKDLLWQEGFESKRKNKRNLLFNHESLNPERFGFINNTKQDFTIFDSYEDAIMHLFDEMSDLQIESLGFAQCSTKPRRIYVDGGFASSAIFIQFLVQKLHPLEVIKSKIPSGSAIGAALAVNGKSLPEDFFNQHLQIEPLLSSV